MGITLRFNLEDVRKTIAEEFNGTLLPSVTEYKNYRQKLDVHCNICGKDYAQTFQMFRKGYGCTADCKNSVRKSRIKQTNWNIDLIRNIVATNGDVLLSNEYVNDKTQLSIQCGKCATNYKAGWRNYHHIGTRCAKCYFDKRRLTQTDFEKTVSERGDTLVSEYTCSRARVRIKCKCGYVYDVIANSYRIHGSGCMMCFQARNRLSYEEVKHRVEKTGDRLLSETYMNGYTPVQIQCGACGKTFSKPISSPYIPNCVVCNKTKLERYVFEYLTDTGYVFTTEKTFQDLRPGKRGIYRFDFYIDDANLVIEADGAQHFTYIPHFGDKEHFRKIQHRDKIKMEYCRKNNIKVVRISYKELTSKDATKQALDDMLKRVEKELIVFSNDSFYQYLM